MVVKFTKNDNADIVSQKGFILANSPALDSDSVPEGAVDPTAESSLVWVVSNSGAPGNRIDEVGAVVGSPVGDFAGKEVGTSVDSSSTQTIPVSIIL